MGSVRSISAVSAFLFENMDTCDQIGMPDIYPQMMQAGVHIQGMPYHNVILTVLFYSTCNMLGHQAA